MSAIVEDILALSRGKHCRAPINVDSCAPINVTAGTLLKAVHLH